MTHQLYMTRRIVHDIPLAIQQKIWQMVCRRVQVNAEDYLHIFNVNIQKEQAVIQHTQEVPVFKCTAEITCQTYDAQIKIYVIRDNIPNEPAIYTMIFADEY